MASVRAQALGAAAGLLVASGFRVAARRAQAQPPPPPDAPPEAQFGGGVYAGNGYGGPA